MKHKSGFLKLLLLVEVLLLIAVFVLSILGGGIRAIKQKGNANQGNTIGKHHNVEESESQSQTEEAMGDWSPELNDITFSEAVQEKMDSMTVEQKVAQLFVTSPEALTDNDQVTLAGDGTRSALESYPVAGLVYGEGNFLGKTQAGTLLSNTQNMAREMQGMELFLMVEERGGENHSVVAKSLNYSYAATPQSLADAEDVAEAKTQTANIATYLKDIGINFVLGPCADLSAGVDPSYDEMTYGGEVSKATALVSEAVSGFQEAGIKTATGTFPGRSYGDVVDVDFSTWREQNQLVYQGAINGNTQALVVSNQSYPALTGEEGTPCAQSQSCVAYIRNVMGYEGILMTEEVNPETAIASIQAGMNLLSCKESFKDTYQAVLDAVNNGAISEKQLDQSVGRILTVKLAE